MEEYVFNSFTSGRPISMNTVSNFNDPSFSLRPEQINPILKSIREPK